MLWEHVRHVLERVKTWSAAVDGAAVEPFRIKDRACTLTPWVPGMLTLLVTRREGEVGARARRIGRQRARRARDRPWRERQRECHTELMSATTSTPSAGPFSRIEEPCMHAQAR